MGWNLINTEIPEKLSTDYGLRMCEALEKNRLLDHGKDHVGYFIYIIGKGKRKRKVHVKEKDYQGIVDYYEDKKHTVSRSTLRRRLLPKAVKYPEQTNKTVTHLGRKISYERLQDNATLHDVIALSEELGHSKEEGLKSYARKKIDASKRNLPHLTP